MGSLRSDEIGGKAITRRDALARGLAGAAGWHRDGLGGTRRRRTAFLYCLDRRK